MILECVCRHEYQDARYGAGRRVHNVMPKDPPEYRCTVCGMERSRKAILKSPPAAARKTKGKGRR